MRSERCPGLVPRQRRCRRISGPCPKIPAPFARLKELEVGDRLTIHTADGKRHRYEVIEKVWATPDQVEYILPQGRELVTMVSCIGDKVVTSAGVEMTHRLITIAAPVR